MALSSSISSRPRIVVDNIHGDIALTENEWAVVNTATFQRLRRIKQLGMGHLTYPNATHTRFAHSLGVFGTMCRILSRLDGGEPRVETRDKENLRLAALLHDIGHYPYSHLVEMVDSVLLTEEQIGPRNKELTVSRERYPNHEKVGQTIVEMQDDLVRAIGSKDRAREIGNLFAREKAADQQLSKLIHSSLDMDRMDYLLRDAKAAGVPYGVVDLNYLLNSIKVSPKGVVGVDYKAIAAAEHFLLARLFMHRTVYFHKTTYAFEEACRQLLRRLRDTGESTLPADGNEVLQWVAGRQLLDFTDDYVDKVIREAETGSKDEVARVLARCITTRRPPRLLAEVSGLHGKDQKHNACETFLRECVYRLQALAEKYQIAPGRFLICRVKPIKFEERSALLTRSEHDKLQPEEREELIKVFVPGDPEPRSLIDVDGSVIGYLASQVYAIGRLYLADPDSELSPQRLAEMVAEVQQWKQG